MKRILAIAFLVLSLQAGAQNLTGTPAASADAPEWVAGKTTYFNHTPGGQLGNVVVVKQNGLPGLWNNQFGGGWILQPGIYKELFFASSKMFFAVNQNGRGGFVTIEPDFDNMKPGQKKEPWLPFDEVSYYPSRSNLQYICVRMQNKWAVLGSNANFLMPACWESPEEAISYMKENHRKPAGEDPAAFIMRCFMNMGEIIPEISAIGREPGKKGAFVSLDYTPYAGPYYLPDVPSDKPLNIGWSAFCVKDGFFCLSNAKFFVGEEGIFWYDDDYVDTPIIPLNMVTLKAAGYPAARGSDGGLYFGPGSEPNGLWLKPDGTFKFGWVPLSYKWSDSSYVPFDHQDWYVDDWRVPVEMTFHEFYFGFDLAEYLSDPENYDEDAVWEKAKKIYLKPNFAFTQRYPMSADSYDTNRQALKMVFGEQACPPIWIPMTEAEANALMASVKKYGTGLHVWNYTRGLDNEGYDIVTEASVGYYDGKVFRYKRAE